MKPYIFLILITVALVGVGGLFFESQNSITGEVFLSERLCQPGYTSMLYVEKTHAGGYFKPTVVCVGGDRVPAIGDTFKLGEENAAQYDRFRTDPYRFSMYN